MYINYILFLKDNFVNAFGNNVKIVINKTIKLFVKLHDNSLADLLWTMQSQ